MWLSSLSIRRPVSVIMAVCIILILGFISFGNLSVDLYPEFNLPFALVMTSYDGAGPEEIENLVTRPIEEAMATLNGVDQIFSESMPGSSMVFIAMNWGTDMDFAALRIREQLDFISGFLPDDAGSPMVFQMDMSMMPIMIFGVTGSDDLAFLRDFVENEIEERLMRIEGVASVGVIGGLTREIHVLVDPVRMGAFGLSIDQITGALRSDNINFATGQIVDGNREFFVRTIGQFDNIDDIGNIVLNLPRGGHVLLRDIADIRDTHRDVNQITRINGEPSIGINIMSQSGSNTVQVAAAIKTELERIEREQDGAIAVTIGFDQSEFINESIASVTESAALGGILAVVVLFVFLRNIRSTFVIAAAIPISLIAAFVLLYFGNLTINMMTLGGLALGIGLMVDNAIVVLENIYRHRQEGYSRIEAARLGAGEVSSAVTAVTLTTFAVFLPIVFVQGIAAELFRDLALTVTFALGVSLIVALTLVPMLSSKLLVVETVDKRIFLMQVLSRGIGTFLEWLNFKYKGVLSWALSHRKTVIAVVTVAMLGSFALVPMVGTSFLPSADAGEISIRVDLARGTVIEETDALAMEIEEYLSTLPEIESIFVSIAPPRDGFLGGAATERISMDVRLVNLAERDRSAIFIADEIRSRLALIPGANIRVVALDPAGMAGGGGSPVQIRVKGSDLGVLMGLAEEVQSVLETIPGIREVDIPAAHGDPEYKIYVNRLIAAQYGLSVAHVANTARAVLEGQTATQFRTGATEIAVRVMYPERHREGLGAMMDTYIMSPSGIQVPLSMVAEVQPGIGMARITREDQVRTLTVSAQIIGRDLGSIMVDAEERIGAEIQVPVGYSINLGGDMEEMMDAFASLFLALMLGIVLVYMVMASQFESLMYPFIIMFTIPTTFIGVVLSLAITGRELSVPTFIGIIMVVGIVVNNGIILVDYINILRRRGMERNEAILKAGPVRLRPILMTSISTILALLPIAIGIGVGAETTAPMATAVIGGLLMSSIFTLVLIPVVYTLFDDLGNWIKRMIGWQGGQFEKKDEQVTIDS